MKTKLRMPGVNAVAATLVNVKSCVERGEDCDIRLQVYPNGEWTVRWGDSSYDQDHRGYWGCSSIDRSTNCRELAKDLIDQCWEGASQCGELVQEETEKPVW